MALDLFQTLKLALEIETYQAPLALFKYSTLNDQSWTSYRNLWISNPVEIVSQSCLGQAWCQCVWLEKQSSKRGSLGSSTWSEATGIWRKRIQIKIKKVFQRGSDQENQPSHVPPLKNKPETTHPCVDHRSEPIHRNLQTVMAGSGGMKRTNQKAWLGADQPSCHPWAKTSRPERGRGTGFRCGSGKIQDWYSNSVGLGIMILIQHACMHACSHAQAHTHTLKGKQLQGRVHPETVTKQRGLERLVCVVADLKN